MNFKIVPFAFICLFLTWPDELGIPPEPPPEARRIAIHEGLELSPEQAEVAEKVEKRLLDYEFSDELILGILVNAYAESQFDQFAVGKEGERGIFQLHPNGLGKGMKVSEMRDVDTSVDRIVKAMLRNDRMLQLIESGGSAEDHIRAFCEEIERPSNRREKAKQRVNLLRKIADEEKICESSVHLQLCA